MFKNRLASFDPQVEFLRAQLPPKLNMEKLANKLESKVQESEQKLFNSMHINEVLPKGIKDLRSLSDRDCKLILYAGTSIIFEDFTKMSFVWDHVLSVVESSEKRSLYKALTFSYFQIYGNGIEADRILRIIIFNKGMLSPSWLKKLEQYELLEKGSHTKLAKKLFESTSPGEILQQLHLNAMLKASMFSVATFQQYCMMMHEKGVTHDRLSLFLELYCQTDEKGKLSPFYSGQEGWYARALLGYWQNHTLDDYELKDNIKKFLVQSFHDPRMYPQRWVSVSPDFTMILKRWLTEESFEVLLEVLGAVADQGHWQDRKDFWTYYLKNNLITDSWVIFGSLAHHQAKKMQREKKIPESAKFAKFQRGNGSVQANHSVILMKIGDLIISEWTHSGKVRIFRSGSEYKPDFYKAEYGPNKIRFETQFYYRHSNNEIYMTHTATHDRATWPKAVAEYIRENTGINHPATYGEKY